MEDRTGNDPDSDSDTDTDSHSFIRVHPRYPRSLRGLKCFLFLTLVPSPIRGQASHSVDEERED